MTITDELFGSEAFTPVNKKLAKLVGFTTAGYFGELLRQRKRFGQASFFFSQDDMEGEIGISSYEQRQSAKMLKEKGFISFIKKGIPAKHYYTIEEEKVEKWLYSHSFKFGSTSGEKSEAQDLQNLEHKTSKKGSTINKSDNKNKSNNDNKTQQTDIESLEIYELYIANFPSDKRKYFRKAQAMLYIQQLMREKINNDFPYTFSYLSSCIKNYKEETKPLYWLSPQYFFSNSKSLNAKHYRPFMDYYKEGDNKPTETPEEQKDKMKKALAFFNPS